MASAALCRPSPQQHANAQLRSWKKHSSHSFAMARSSTRVSTRPLCAVPAELAGMGCKAESRFLQMLVSTSRPIWDTLVRYSRRTTSCFVLCEHARLLAYWSRQRMALNESSARSFITLRYIKKKAWSPENITIKFMHNVRAIHARCWGDDICAYARLPGHCSSYITSTNCQQAVYQYLL